MALILMFWKKRKLDTRRQSYKRKLALKNSLMVHFLNIRLNNMEVKSKF